MYWENCPAVQEAGKALLRADPVPDDAGAVAAVKDYLRIERDEEDALIARLVSVAIGQGERFVRRALIARTMREVRRRDMSWVRLEAAPVAAITSVEDLASDGTASALPVEAYAIDIDAGGDGWVRCMGPGRIRVTYRAGLAADWASLPEPIAQGIVRLAAHLFTHRDALADAPPAAVAALWRPWRRMGLR